MVLRTEPRNRLEKHTFSVCFPDSLREALDPTQVYPSFNSIIFTARPQVLQTPNKGLRTELELKEIT